MKKGGNSALTSGRAEVLHCWGGRGSIPSNFGFDFKFFFYIIILIKHYNHKTTESSRQMNVQFIDRHTHAANNLLGHTLQAEVQRPKLIQNKEQIRMHCAQSTENIKVLVQGGIISTNWSFGPWLCRSCRLNVIGWNKCAGSQHLCCSGPFAADL